ncbi:MAG TPA: NADH:flavin oxidoreductase/NADH oxidase family protein, partial [Myxococcaceae bacterium]|nr:NADH:flavin oxidoreductase/NADH oxidase family protein [Myxococcaceae bacterium]
RPLTLPCGLTVPNRIAKAAMTERLAGVNGRANEHHARLFRRFAQGGAGLLITGNVVVDSRYLEAPGNVFIEDAQGLESLSAWAAAGKAGGGLMIMQINHAGRQTPASVSDTSVAPSAVRLNMRNFFSTPRAMTGLEIEEVIGRFAFAASVAQRAGFDGVEVHAAHGYLLSQFLSPRVNQRSDEWGGSIENRARILLRIVRAIRAGVEPGFAVGVKLNVADFIKGGLEFDDALRVVDLLSHCGVDFIEVSGGTHERAVSFGFEERSANQAEAHFKDYATAVRKRTRVPVILTGGIRSRRVMEQVLSNGLCDLVGLARPLTVEPDLPLRLLNGTSESAQSFSLKLPPPPRANLVELLWSREQLIRIANDRPPKLTASPRFSLLRMIWEDRVFKRRRAKHVRTTGPEWAPEAFVALARSLTAGSDSLGRPAHRESSPNASR